MTSKRSNTASAKGRDIAPGVPAQKGSVMENASDNGRLADATGLSSASPIEPVPVSPVPASIPSAYDLWKLARGIRFHLSTNLVYRSTGRDPKPNGFSFAEVPEWQLRQWLDLAENNAQAIEARRAETHSGSVADESAVAKPCAQGASA